MVFQTLKGSRNKKIIIGVIVFITIISMILIGRSYASYRTTQSINVASGTVNYHVPDLRVVAVKLQDETDNTIYNDSSTIPTSGYILNTDKSVCGQPDGNGYANKDNAIILDYRSGRLYADNLKKNTRCYLYFDIQSTVTSEDIIANHKIGIRTFTEALTEETTGTLYVGYDNDGPSYAYAGKVNDNWVKFGKETVDGVQKDIWWRIIRFNGDGSTRMIYTGTTAPTESSQYVMTGSGTDIGYVSYNNQDRAEYVGYYYTLGEAHGRGTASKIANFVNNWYDNNLKSNYENYIDTNGKFCNDRTIISGTGIGTTQTMFLSSYKLFSTTLASPGIDDQNMQDGSIFSCFNSLDEFNLPVGLITLDEALMAGGYLGTNNTAFYLYTNRHYYTMTPLHYCPENSCYAYVGVVNINGNLYSYGSLEWGGNTARPVINLKSNITFIGSGTYNNPYIVS